MKTPRKTVCHFIVGVAGLLLAVLAAILGWVVFPIVVKNQVAETVAIKYGTDAYDRWKELPIKMKFKVYLFNVNNAVDIIEHGAKPNVTEIGPFVYTESRWKENINLNEDDDRATYNQKSIFVFDPDSSVLPDDNTKLTLVNVPALSFAQITENMPALSSSLGTLNQVLGKMFDDPNDPVFIETTVREYLFDGVRMNCDYDNTKPEDVNWMLMCKAYALVHPPSVIINELGDHYNTFSFFKYKNNSYDGLYEVNLGIEDPSNIGQVISWNGVDKVDKWGGDSCNKIQGTDSTIFRPNLDDDDVDALFIFNTDLCRTIKLTYDSDTEYKDIAGRRYVTDRNVLAGVLENEDNYCYCPQSVNGLTDYGGCLKSGLVELSSCQGAPVILSHPHFLFADSSYQEMVDGLSPDVDLHQIRVDLEKYTGTPLRGAAKIQMNILLKRIEEIDVMKNYPNTLIPLLWIEEGVELNQELIDTLNSELFYILYILDVTRWCLIGAGILLVIGTIGFFIYFKQKRRQLKQQRSATAVS